MADEYPFLFSSVPSALILTTRKIHIRRLYDLLHLSIQRRDIPRARRAWAILARCKEIDWMAMWTAGVCILDGDPPQRQSQPRKVEFLRAMMFQNPGDRVLILKELLLSLIHSGRYRDALDELELYLPSFPYQDYPILHVYAGLLSVYLAQPLQLDNPNHVESDGANVTLLRDAQTHFHRALSLDPHNIVAQSFIEKLPMLAQRSGLNQAYEQETDDENFTMEENSSPRQKRSRLSPR